MVLVPLLILHVAIILTQLLVKPLKIAMSKKNDGWYYYGEDGNAIRPQNGEANIDGQIVYPMPMVVKLKESLFSTMVFFATMILILEHASLTPL